MTTGDELVMGLTGGMKIKHPKNCKCNCCCDKRKSRRKSRGKSRGKSKKGGFSLEANTYGGRRRGRPCKSLKRKKKRRPNKTRKMRR